MKIKQLHFGLGPIKPLLAVFSKQFFRGKGGRNPPPHKIQHFNGFCKFCFYKGLDTFKPRNSNLHTGLRSNGGLVSLDKVSKNRLIRLD